MYHISPLSTKYLNVSLKSCFLSFSLPFNVIENFLYILLEINLSGALIAKALFFYISDHIF